MKNAYANLDKNNRVDGATYYEQFAGDWPLREFPDDFDMNNARDWVLVDGEFVRDPLPEPEPLLTIEEVDAKATEAKTTADTVQEQMDALTSAFDTEVTDNA